jgi:DNA-binding MarR family transcriptional regulator
MAAGSWSFLTNHFLVLAHVSQRSNSTGREIAEAIGITERAVRDIIADLQAGEYIELERTGRRNQYHVNPQRLIGGRGGHQMATVGDLLSLLGN